MTRPSSATYLLLLTLAACAAPEEPAQPEHAAMPHDHGHHQAHPADPEDFERWIQALDDPERAAWQKPAEVVAALALDPGMVVADVGAGTGYFEPPLSQAVGPTGRVLALEINAELVRRMQQRFQAAQLDNVEARLVTPADPGLGQGAVDRVLIVDTWHHMHERAAYAQTLRAALRPGGRLLIVDYGPESPTGPPPHLRLAPADVVAELEQAGLRAEVLAETLPRQFMIVGRAPDEARADER